MVRDLRAMASQLSVRVSTSPLNCCHNSCLPEPRRPEERRGGWKGGGGGGGGWNNCGSAKGFSIKKGKKWERKEEEYNGEEKVNSKK